MKTSKRLRRNIAIWLAAGLFMTGTAGMAAGPIMPDPKAEARHQPQVEETANGIPERISRCAVFYFRDLIKLKIDFNII